MDLRACGHPPNGYMARPRITAPMLAAAVLAATSVIAARPPAARWTIGEAPPTLDFETRPTGCSDDRFHNHR